MAAGPGEHLHPLHVVGEEVVQPRGRLVDLGEAVVRLAHRAHPVHHHQRLAGEQESRRRRAAAAETRTQPRRCRGAREPRHARRQQLGDRPGRSQPRGAGHDRVAARRQGVGLALRGGSDKGEREKSGEERFHRMVRERGARRQQQHAHTRRRRQYERINFLNEAPRRTRGFTVTRRAVKETGSLACTALSHVPRQVRGDRRVPHRRTVVDVQQHYRAALSRRSQRAAYGILDGSRRAGEPLSFTARQRSRARQVPRGAPFRKWCFRLCLRVSSVAL
jgi:hypothetical protein